MGPKLIFRLLIALCLGAIITPADSLELKNGSLIKGRFVGGTEAEIRFQAGSSVQKYAVADIVSLKFESDTRVSETPSTRDQEIEALASVTVPSGTRLSVRTIDAIDSAKNHVGDRFEASLEEPVTVDGRVVVPKGASVYGRLEDAKTSGTFTGRSELRLALTEIVVNGQTVPLVSGEYELNGKSRGASTAKRTIGGAAVGTIIGALAGGGKGAAIGAGTGGALGAGSEIITKGDQVKIPSETLLDFTLEQNVSMPVHQNRVRLDSETGASVERKFPRCKRIRALQLMANSTQATSHRRCIDGTEVQDG